MYFSNTELPEEHYTYDLVTKMIEHKKEKRIALVEVIEILENSPKCKTLISICFPVIVLLPLNLLLLANK